GRPGHFSEMDLMQEHHNFWLEDMAQHKGKEFDDDFYRKTLSLCVRDFLHLKDEMEETVELEERTKKHGEPHQDNELRAGMALLRLHEVNRRRPGRDHGFIAVDDFEEGYAVLGNKIPKFIVRTT
ncbi:hypothetical protein BV25DRAFT_1776663, partial [Artomyces pyxidatus]